MDYSSILSILISLVLGGVIGFIGHYFSTKETVNSTEPTNSESKEDKLVGKIDLTPLRNRFHKLEEKRNKTNEDFAENVGQGANSNLTDSSNDDDDDYEEIPYMRTSIKEKNEENDTNEENQETQNDDQLSADKINATFGKLHGKLATAQLKAKTRQIAAEMSNEEKDYEDQMKNSQMASILNLMMQNREKFGMSSDDIKEQMNLYDF